MTQFTNRADLLIAAGESIRMQENAGIKPQCKLKGWLTLIEHVTLDAHHPTTLEFPLAVIEGKPVFVGDELYIDNNYKKIKITEHTAPSILPRCSWNPPKPKTVIVELLIDDAYKFINCGIECPSYSAAFAALNKALEK
jgi:hypothetical protein